MDTLIDRKACSRTNTGQRARPQPVQQGRGRCKKKQKKINFDIPTTAVRRCMWLVSLFFRICFTLSCIGLVLFNVGVAGSTGI